MTISPHLRITTRTGKTAAKIKELHTKLKTKTSKLIVRIYKLSHTVTGSRNPHEKIA